MKTCKILKDNAATEELHKYLLAFVNRSKAIIVTAEPSKFMLQCFNKLKLKIASSGFCEPRCQQVVTRQHMLCYIPKVGFREF